MTSSFIEQPAICQVLAFINGRNPWKCFFSVIPNLCFFCLLKKLNSTINDYVSKKIYSVLSGSTYFDFCQKASVQQEFDFSVIILLLFEASSITYCTERDELVTTKHKGTKRVGRPSVRFLADFDLVHKAAVDLIIKVFYTKCKCGEAFIRKGSCSLQNNTHT